MAKEAFITHNFKAASLELIEIANEIIDEYAEQGIDRLSLRQVYYRFIARNVFPNDLRRYKTLGRLISMARMAGLIDWRVIEDRGRQLNRLSHWDSPADIVAACAEQYNVDLWEDQPWRVEVWTEKDAAISVIDDLCARYDVPYLACRGDSSTTAEYEGAMRFRRYRNKDQKCVIIYCGDHDPAGLSMSSVHDRRLNEEFQVQVQVDRIALNLDQVRRYGLAPNPVKKADSKSKAYIEQFGEDCWEIEALDPAVLQNLIERAILKYGDWPRFGKRSKLRDRARAKLAKVAKLMR